MITGILLMLGVLATLFLMIGLPWVLTYIPGSKEDREWLNYVYERTAHGWIHWKVKEGENFTSNPVLRGRDQSKEELHELHIHSRNSRFLYSYSLAGAEDDGYTHNKRQLAHVSISPWAPMNRLTKAALAQIKTGEYLAPEQDQEPVDIITPGLCYTKEKERLFGLNWGEEPEWVRNKDVRLQ
jgi:hypothetical protein